MQKNLLAIFIFFTSCFVSTLVSADINVCMENGKRVITTGACRSGKSPQKSFVTPPQADVKPTYQPTPNNSTRWGASRRVPQIPVPRPVGRNNYSEHSAQNEQTEEFRHQLGGTLEPDQYGPGIHGNQYGQPVTVAPDYGGVQGEQLQLQQNTYGPGIHMDQYGRPVREYPLR